MRELAPEPRSPDSDSESTGRRRKYDKTQATNSQKPGPSVAFEDNESLMPTPPSSHHHISRDVRHKVNLLAWLGDNQFDPALEVSLSPPNESEV
jgi:hypothetical protein